MNTTALHRSQPRIVSTAARPVPTASPRSPERAQPSLALGRVDPGMLTRLGSLFAPASRPAARDAAPAGGPLVHGTRPNAAIQDNQSVTSTLDVPENVKVESLALELDIAHSYRGDLVVKLTSPSGKSAVVSNREGGSADNLQGRFDLSAFAGEPAAGRWTLTVQDAARADQGTLKSWGLSITPRGTPTEPTEPTEPPSTDPFQGLRDAALLKAIKGASAGKHVRGYSEARKLIFGEVDVHAGKVSCVYTGREIAGGRIPNSSDMNVEHTWPQSKGATGAAKSDLHHLFPTDSRANSIRSSYPFGKVVDVKWSHESGAKLGKDAQGRTVFEPPDAHKGNVARAMFYFSAEYSHPIPEFEEAVLKEWNHQDAVDAAEIERNRRIASIQGNRNQFVEHAELADRIRDF
jgi:subtilisin-like proprotein convertase family protein